MEVWKITTHHSLQNIFTNFPIWKENKKCHNFQFKIIEEGINFNWEEERIKILCLIDK